MADAIAANPIAVAVGHYIWPNKRTENEEKKVENTKMKWAYEIDWSSQAAVVPKAAAAAAAQKKYKL